MGKSKLMIVLAGTVLVAGCGSYGSGRGYDGYTSAQEDYIAFRNFCSYNPQAQKCLNALSPGGGANNTGGGGHGGGHGGHGK